MAFRPLFCLFLSGRLRQFSLYIELSLMEYFISMMHVALNEKDEKVTEVI